jgi:predicted phage terminase large subunit-like protein
MANLLSKRRWTLTRHLIKLSESLVELAARRITRLIVEMPPRHGKSELISHYFPVWYLNQWPDQRIILASYEADFAESWGRKVRNTIEEGKGDLEVKLGTDSLAARRWDTKDGGGMITAGVGGPITGKGANLLIMDDPVKNAEEAYSSIYREKIWDWWRSTAYTRLEPGGVAIIVMTRWHKDDLVGRLIAEMDGEGERWDVLRLPALAEAKDPLQRMIGQPLWPMRFDKPALAKIRKAIGSQFWSSLYQQNPTDKEGSMFKREWFKIVDEAPADARPVRFWDLAASDPKTRKDDPDWTSGGSISMKEGQYWIHRIDRMRGRPKAVEDFIRQCAVLDGRGASITIEQEPGSSGVNTIDHYQRIVLPGYTVRGERSTGSKSERAEPVSSAAEAGNVFLVKGPWVRDFLDEIANFPVGAHDDQVDCVSGAFKVLSTKAMPGFFVIGGKG